MRLGCSSASDDSKPSTGTSAPAFLFLRGGVATRITSSGEGERFLAFTFCFFGDWAVFFAVLFLGGRPRLFGGGATGSGSGAPERSSQKVGEGGGEGEFVNSVKGLDGGVLIRDAMVFRSDWFGVDEWS